MTVRKPVPKKPVRKAPVKAVKRVVVAPKKKQPPIKRKISRTVGIEPDANVPPVLRTPEDIAEAEAIKEALVDSIVDLTREVEELRATEKGLRTDLTEKMVVDEDKRIVSVRGKATLVQPENAVIDEKKLKTKVGAQMWTKITTRKLDKNKLDAFVKSGEITAEVVAACTDLVEGTPYVRVTPR